MKVYRIRKLTPREAGRLMDVEDPDIDKMLSCGLSDAALYKMYGNSIVTSCLAGIFDIISFRFVENTSIQFKLLMCVVFFSTSLIVQLYFVIFICG